MEAIKNVPDSSIISPELLNVIPSSAKEIRSSFLIELKGDVFWQWRSLKPAHPLNYFLALNESLQSLGYGLSSNSANRIGVSLRTRTYRFVKKVRALNTKLRRETIADSWFSLKVWENEMVQTPKKVIQIQNTEAEAMGRRLEEISKNLEEENSKTYEVLVECLKIKKENDHLKQGLVHLMNQGKNVSQVQQRQKNRKMKQLREQSRSVLWFAKTFGLIPTQLTLEEESSGVQHTISLDSHKSHGSKDHDQTPEVIEETTATSATTSNWPEQGTPTNTNISPSRAYRIKKYLQLPDEDKEKIKQLTHIINKFGVSYEAYHEITQISGNEDIPRAYLVEGCEGHLDSKWDIKKTPGSTPGAELSFKQLLSQQLRRNIESNGISDPEKKTFKIKISGDGAAITKKSNLLVCSFSIIDQGNTMMSSLGNHTIAVVQTSEDYASLKLSLSNVIKEVNDIEKQGYIDVDDSKVKLQLFLGGDYKFLLLCFGMKQATSNHSCIYCKVDKLERQDMTKAQDYFCGHNIKRILDHDTWHTQPGCRFPPLFKIPLDRCVLDELHLMLRVTDRLEHGLIYDAVDWDEQDNFGIPKAAQKTLHLDNLVSSIQSCGVGFRVWLNKENKLDWTSLMGGDKKKLLRNLPAKFKHFVRPSELEKVTKLWKDFGEIYDILTSLTPTDDEIRGFHEQAKKWASLLLSMKSEGYNWSFPITPYIHMMVYHVPHMMERLGDLKKFTGQGVEKKNDDMRKAFHGAINRWDACKSLIVIDKRLEVLAENKRTKRKYTKQNLSFWEEGGKAAVVKNYPRISLPEKAQIPMDQQTNFESNHIIELPDENDTHLTYTHDQLKKMTVVQLRHILNETSEEPVNKRARKPLLIEMILEQNNK